MDIDTEAGLKMLATLFNTTTSKIQDCATTLREIGQLATGQMPPELIESGKATVDIALDALNAYKVPLLLGASTIAVAYLAYQNREALAFLGSAENEGNREFLWAKRHAKRGSPHTAPDREAIAPLEATQDTTIQQSDQQSDLPPIVDEKAKKEEDGGQAEIKILEPSLGTQPDDEPSSEAGSDQELAISEALNIIKNDFPDESPTTSPREALTKSRSPSPKR